MKNKYYLNTFFSVLFFAISIYSFYRYNTYRDAINEKQPIKYKLIQKAKKGGRGHYYTMDVIYKNQSYSVSITRKEYHEIEDNIFPFLYYSENSGSVFSEWDMNASFRVFIIFSIGCIISVSATVWYKLMKSTNKQNTNNIANTQGV